MENNTQVMRHGSLFSGVGGFDLASEWMGWENVFHCEINEFCQKVLKYYWPNAKTYTDIKSADFTEWRGLVDIVTGGFPCQPYSQAGKRKGKADDRHLWPEMLRAIKQIQPRWVAGENVYGLLNWGRGMVLDEIKADLETAGFEVFPPLVLPACAVNAPHRRDRVWIVAHSSSKRFQNHDEGSIQDEFGYIQSEAQRRQQQIGDRSISDIGTSNSNSNGQHWSDSEYEINTSEGGFDALNDIEQNDFTNASNQGLQGSEKKGNADGIGTERNKQFAGSFRPTWQNFPTQPPICCGNDGLPPELVGITFPKHRNESIKGYGNAIVPQVAFQIFKTIEKYELLINKTP